MQTRPFGPARVAVPRIGLGTWRVNDHAAATRAITAGIDLGLTHIDTAELYEQKSRSETMLKSVLAGRREKVFLASKVLPQNASFEGTLAACEASLARLGTDRLDLYYLHWRGPHTLEQTMDAMAELVEAGKVRHIGVSNFDVADLEEAESLLGEGVLAANQILYHLEDRGVESEVIPWCNEHGVAVVAYSPLGAGAWLTKRRHRAVIEEVARAAGKTPVQVALSFLTRDANGLTAEPAEGAEATKNSAVPRTPREERNLAAGRPPRGAPRRGENRLLFRGRHNRRRRLLATFAKRAAASRIREKARAICGICEI